MRQLKTDNKHQDLQKGDLIVVACNGTHYIGIYSQLTKRNVVRFISIDKDLSQGYCHHQYNVNTKKYEPIKIRDYSYERRFEIEHSRRSGYSTGYRADAPLLHSSFLPYHVDLLTDKQKENYQAIRTFLRCDN